MESYVCIHYYLVRCIPDVLVSLIFQYFEGCLITTLSKLLEILPPDTRVCFDGHLDRSFTRIYAHRANYYHLAVSFHTEDIEVENLYLDDGCSKCQYGEFCSHNPRLVRRSGSPPTLKAFQEMLQESMKLHIALTGSNGGARAVQRNTFVLFPSQPIVQYSFSNVKDRAILAVDYDSVNRLVIIWSWTSLRKCMNFQRYTTIYSMNWKPRG